MSLRTGGPVATALQPLINPNNLKIEGWFCADKFKKNTTLILQTQDVRDILPQGIVVNDYEVLSDPEELVRLKEPIEIAFDPLGKQVVTVNKKKLGKVNDYAVEMNTFYIQKLYVAQSFLKSISGGSLSVDRNQIVEITDKKIVINDPLQPLKAGEAENTPAIEAAPAT